jgi:RHS repeat-associated protein
VSQTTLQLSSEAEKALVDNRIYRATGQLQEETLGSGIKLHYDYESDTQRLKEKRATRLSDNKRLQSLRYTYDPVGNILSIEDKAQETEYYKNDQAESISQYVYDTLYQLVSTSGVESEQASYETSRLSHAVSFGNKDASRLVNYHRSYSYDAGGNLFEIKHRGANTCTQELTIDILSNRGIAKRETGPTLQESFDGNGNLLYLNINQPLSWDSRNQLQETIQVGREASISDKETYLYDGQGMRVQKTRIFLTESQIHTERVRYLNGLELREHWQTDDLQGQNKQIREELHLIQASNGEVPVKVLHWESGKPDEIENDAIYYSLSDHLGSHQLELNNTGEIISFESYYPYGGTAIWSTRNQVESSYKYYRYSGKERDHSGLYYYGYRYYMPWLGRWINADPSGTEDGLNLFRMARNNPITFVDDTGKLPTPADMVNAGIESMRQQMVETLQKMHTLLHKHLPTEALQNFRSAYGTRDVNGEWLAVPIVPFEFINARLVPLLLEVPQWLSGEQPQKLQVLALRKLSLQQLRQPMRLQNEIGPERHRIELTVRVPEQLFPLTSLQLQLHQLQLQLHQEQLLQTQEGWQLINQQARNLENLQIEHRQRLQHLLEQHQQPLLLRQRLHAWLSPTGFVQIRYKQRESLEAHRRADVETRSRFHRGLRELHALQGNLRQAQLWLQFLKSLSNHEWRALAKRL